MIQKIYTVFDAKAEAYIQPFFSPNDAMATRSFESACNDSAHDFFRHAEDYTLFCIGDFDADHGNLNAVIPGLLIAKAHELRIND